MPSSVGHNPIVYVLIDGEFVPVNQALLSPFLKLIGVSSRVILGERLFRFEEHTSEQDSSSSFI